MAYSSKKTSFTPKSRQIGPQIRGTIPSLHNNLLLTSTGVPSIDSLVGCIPIGTILLLEEDKYQNYSQMIMKYFLSEGIECGHDIYFASGDVDVDTFVKQLPSAIPRKDVQENNSFSGNELKIAWRYEKNYDQTTFKKFSLGRNFDTTKAIPSEKLVKCNITTFDALDEHEKTKSCVFNQLFTKIKSKLTESGYTAIALERMPSKIMRIAISGMASPQWSAQNNQLSLIQFIYKLRYLLRSSLAVCLITVPTISWEDSSFISRMRHVCDTVIRLESFAASDKETNPLYKDFHGLIKIEKLPRLNSLVCRSHEDIRDLAFKLRKKKFSVEKLHLPPLDSEEPRVQNFCSSKPGGNKRIEF
uniref:Elongator complex protein 4 n=1 Tax=Strigamia maritima TaxID=126957 RepID=T1JA61_STRMM